jgi:hypothetical protein
MILHFFALTAVSATIIPFHFDEDYRPFVSNATIPGDTDFNASIAVMITLQSSSYAAFGSLRVNELSGRRGILLGDTFVLGLRIINGLLRYRLFRLEVDNMIHLGIGRASRLLEHYGAISVLNNESSGTGLLILEDLDAVNFNLSCTPGSIIRIPFRDRRDTLGELSDSTIGVSHALVFRNGTEALDREWSTSSVHSYAVPYPTSLGIPEHLAREIHSIIDSSVAGRRDRMSSKVPNCNFRSLIDQLPQIKLSVTESTAEIVLSPEDYIAFNRETSECIVRIAIATRQSTPFLNPLAIPGINMHITIDGIALCDSIE